MKHIKLFENFNDIHIMCKRIGIKNYTVSPDGLVNVDGDINFADSALGKLPIKFGKITGSFFCNGNNLKTLEGAPHEVGDHFFCNGNELTTLEGAPKEVGSVFSCSNNKLVKLEGSPRIVGRDFVCSDNNLISLEAGPSEVGRDFVCDGNPIYQVYKLFPNYKSYMDSIDYGYLRGKTIDKKRLQEALDEVGIEIPESIIGYKWI